MRQRFEVEMDDGTRYEIDADARDIRAWEADHAASWFATPTSFTTVCQLAYTAGVRTGVLNGRWPDYGTFDAHCVDARGARSEGLVADPTRQAATDGSSVPSPSAATPPRRPSRRKDLS